MAFYSSFAVCICRTREHPGASIPAPTTNPHDKSALDVWLLGATRSFVRQRPRKNMNTSVLPAVSLHPTCWRVIRTETRNTGLFRPVAPQDRVLTRQSRPEGRLDPSPHSQNAFSYDCRSRSPPHATFALLPSSMVRIP